MTPYYEDVSVTIYHGDCREIDAWDIAGGVMVTDPPYGMSFKSGRPRAVNNSTMGDLSIVNDHDTSTRDNALATWGNRPALVMGRWSEPRPAATRAVLTWEKGEHVGMGDLALPWKPNTEEIYVLGAGFVGFRSSSVLRYLAVAGCVGNANTGHRNHPMEKPVELMRDLIGKCPPPAEIVDPFMGSGTTLRAAKDLGRHAIGVELNERYCEIAARRMAQEVLDFTA